MKLSEQGGDGVRWRPVGRLCWGGLPGRSGHPQRPHLPTTVLVATLKLREQPGQPLLETDDCADVQLSGCADLGLTFNQGADAQPFNVGPVSSIRFLLMSQVY